MWESECYFARVIELRTYVDVSIVVAVVAVVVSRVLVPTGYFTRDMVSFCVTMDNHVRELPLPSPACRVVSFEILK